MAQKDALYNEFKKHFQEISALGSILGLAGWDQQVKMPAGAALSRQNQMQALSGVLHKKSIDAGYGKTIQKLYDLGSDSFDQWQWKNITLARKSFNESTKLPEKLVQQSAALMAKGYAEWERAQKEDDFSIFAPVVSEWVELKSTINHILYPDRDIYDSCLDTFEEGLNSSFLDKLFGQLKKGLKEILNNTKPIFKEITPLKGPFSIEKQEKLNDFVAKAMGFDFHRGRIDVSSHPFTGGCSRNDVRLTTRYDEQNFISSLSSMMHEVGHALYEQALPEKYENLPVGSALGMAGHESQSLLWERMIFQNKKFWQWLLPIAKDAFKEQLKDVSIEQIFYLVNEVKPGPIRIAADELTYPMHIILRYEMEKGLFRKDIKVGQLKDAWNSMSKELLGVEPKSDKEGVLQDIHWSDGSYGYFPCYTLGALYGAQFYEAIENTYPNLDSEIVNGNLGSIKEWLNENIHSQGCLYTLDELTKKTTNSCLSAEHYLDYLKNKYN
jgi:carboxypeptidase Taq